VGNGAFARCPRVFPSFSKAPVISPTSLPNPPRILSDVPHQKRDPEEALVKAL
jgi:hypothetical protein